MTGRLWWDGASVVVIVVLALRAREMGAVCSTPTVMADPVAAQPSRAAALGAVRLPASVQWVPRDDRRTPERSRRSTRGYQELATH
jgi:hypothetical protein